MKYSRLEQRSVIKFLAAENGKPCEIYWIMCDMYVEAYFTKKIYKGAKHRFAITSSNRKSSVELKHTDFSIKFQVQQPVKKVIHGMGPSLLISLKKVEL